MFSVGKSKPGRSNKTRAAVWLSEVCRPLPLTWQLCWGQSTPSDTGFRKKLNKGRTWE